MMGQLFQLATTACCVTMETTETTARKTARRTDSSSDCLLSQSTLRIRTVSTSLMIENTMVHMTVWV